MHWARIGAGVVLVALVGFAGYAWMNRTKTYGDTLAKEVQLQKPEIEECKARLETFYKAWDAYRKDNKGAEPPSFEKLVPKYIKDPNTLICPTAKRLSESGKRVEQGSITIGRRQYPVTYGFLWLTSGNARRVKKLGDQAPLVVCSSHEEAMYQAAYHKHPQADAFAPEMKSRLAPEVQETHMLAVLRNGQVKELTADEEP